MKTIILTILLFLLMTADCLACSCLPVPSFCVISNSSLAVLEVEVVERYSNSDEFYPRFVDFKVLNKLSANSNVTYENITLIEAGSSCDLFMYDSLEKGDRLVINFDRIFEESGANYSVINFSSCSNNVLRIMGDQVIGKITNDLNEEEQKLSYLHFKNNIHDICELGNLSETSVEISNNLVENHIDLKNNHGSKLNYQIYSSSGQLIKNDSIESNEIHRVFFEGYSSDVYFIRFSNLISQFTHKIVKV